MRMLGWNCDVMIRLDRIGMNILDGVVGLEKGGRIDMDGMGMLNMGKIWIFAHKF